MSGFPKDVQTSRTTRLDSRRNRIAADLANTALRLATDDYRDFIEGSIRYGLEAAIRDVKRGDLGIREADCGCCYIVDAVSLDQMRAAVERVRALADEWERRDEHAGSFMWGRRAADLRVALDGLLAAEGVETGAGRGDDPASTEATSWVNGSEDCPEAPAQAHSLGTLSEAERQAIAEVAWPQDIHIIPEVEQILARHLTQAEADWITLSADTADWQRRAVEAEWRVARIVHVVVAENPRDHPYKVQCSCGEWCYDFAAHVNRVTPPHSSGGAS